MVVERAVAARIEVYEGYGGRTHDVETPCWWRPLRVHFNLCLIDEMQ